MHLPTPDKLLEPNERVLSSEQTREIDPAEHQEADWGEAQHVDISGNLYRKILTIVTNILVLAEVFIAMYFAAQDMDEITPIFFKVFFSLLIPTIIAVIVLRHLISRRFKE